MMTVNGPASRRKTERFEGDPVDAGNDYSFDRSSPMPHTPLHSPAHLPWFILVTLYGACVGSFLNVVIYRLPLGRGLVTPRSSCPRCSHMLAWYDNIPLLGWCWLRGRCRYCKAPISVQYPLIEALCAALFAGVYALDYMSGLRPELMAAGLAATWPVLIVQLVLVAALLGATVIDARLYIIPVRIPQVVTLVALLVLPAGATWLSEVAAASPRVGSQGLGVAIGGAAGLALALLLLHLHLLPRSFDEVEETLDEAAPHDAFLDHPHPRREVLKECLFIVMPVVGALVGSALMYVPQGYLPVSHQYPPGLRVLGGVVLGYLVGAGVVWGVRILGTLVFGREAMGLGDVHLLAGVGAVLGWQDAVAVFFVAPFLGLTGAVVAVGVQKLWRGQGRVIPYGPYLAAATLLVMAFGNQLWSFFGIL